MATAIAAIIIERPSIRSVYLTPVALALVRRLVAATATATATVALALAVTGEVEVDLALALRLERAEVRDEALLLVGVHRPLVELLPLLLRRRALLDAFGL